MATSPFCLLIDDLAGVVRPLALPSARAEHQALGEAVPEVLEIDLAPVLGLDPAPHRVLKLRELTASGLFRLTESNQQLWRSKKLAGWPQAMCYDVAMLCTMHEAPTHEGSGKALVDLYGLFDTKPRLRGLFLYLLERVARAWPDLVRPELRLEVIYHDMRLDLIAQGKDPDEIAEALEQTDPDEIAEQEGLMPLEERLPNA